MVPNFHGGLCRGLLGLHKEIHGLGVREVQGLYFCAYIYTYIYVYTHIHSIIKLVQEALTVEDASQPSRSRFEALLKI